MADPIIVQQIQPNGETHYYVMPDGLPPDLQHHARETVGYVRTCSSIPIVRLDPDPGDLSNALRWQGDVLGATGRFVVDAQGNVRAYDMSPSTGRLEFESVDGSLMIDDGTLSTDEIKAEHAQIIERRRSNEPPKPGPCNVSQSGPVVASDFRLG